MIRLLEGDCREWLAKLESESIHCVVTSPPYWGLRDYGFQGQLGLETTPGQYVRHLAEIFREVKRVLRDDGTAWLNLGDSYTSGDRKDRDPSLVSRSSGLKNRSAGLGRQRTPSGLKPKDLVGIPWRVAFALQADGWWLRSDIIWAKRNPMPESVTDRPTRSHEYVFLLSKSKDYYFDQEAVKEPSMEPRRCGKNSRANADRDPAHGTSKQDAVGNRRYAGFNERYDFEHPAAGRNIRSVWHIATQPYKDAHFATFPEKLIEPCVKAGCPLGGTVLDPFIGSGTTALVAAKLGRDCIGIDAKAEYIEMAQRRVIDECGGLLTEISIERLPHSSQETRTQGEEVQHDANKNC